MKKLTDIQRTTLWACIAVVTVGVAALVWWVVSSRRKNGGLVVIGNVNASEMNTNQNTNGNAQTQFDDMSLPRGYRNNNPLNVRKNAANAWKGKVVPGTDSAFEQFVSMAYGYRCALYLLRKYISQGNNTIRKIISKWAPPSENNTSGYINHVATRSGINADTVIDRNDREKLCKIAYAMAWVENGYAPASMDDIYQGWALL